MSNRSPDRLLESETYRQLQGLIYFHYINMQLTCCPFWMLMTICENKSLSSWNSFSENCLSDYNNDKYAWIKLVASFLKLYFQIMFLFYALCENIMFVDVFFSLTPTYCYVPLSMTSKQQHYKSHKHNECHNTPPVSQSYLQHSTASSFSLE